MRIRFGKPRVLGARLVFFSLLLAPAVLLIEVVNAGIDGGVDVHGMVATHVDDLSRGRVTEGLILLLCFLVMSTTWLRIVWIVVAIFLSRHRGRPVLGSDRLLIRMIVRLLVLTPVVLETSTPHPPTFASNGVVGIEEDSSTISHSVSSRDVLLVSIVAAVGVSWRLRQRRDRALRLGVPLAPDLQTQQFESNMKRQGEDRAFVRLDLAVRSLLAAGRTFRWMVQHSSGLIHVECSSGGINPPLWTRVSLDIFVLEAGVTLEELDRQITNHEIRMPILLPVGRTEAGSIWMNLEHAGSFFVEGGDEEADVVWNGLCQSLSLSPLHTSANLIGTRDDVLFGRRLLVARDDDGADHLARVLHSDDSISIVLTSKDSRREMRVEGDNRGEPARCGLVQKKDSWILLPMHQTIQPTRCDEEDRKSIRELIGDAVPAIRCPASTSNRRDSGIDRHPVVAGMLDEVSFVVRTMGSPSIDHIECGRVIFERARSEELVVWLGLHPHRRRRSAARADMWNISIKDATFSNVTSDVRRSLTAFEIPPEGEQWLSVTLNDDLPLHSRIITDITLLENCLEHARRYPEDGGLDVLSFGLDYVRGSPLEGSQYLWRDATGITTHIAMLVVRASMTCSEMAIESGDVEALYRFSAKGLAAVPGHEGLVSLRMRQHAELGDRASLLSEWESYCRALANDDWGDSRPSEKMIELWSRLSGRHP